MSTFRTGKSASFSRIALNDPAKFCHYKNAMYMGGMKFFQRQGRGILLHDSGEISLTSFEKDKLQGNVLMISKSLQLFSLSYHMNQLVEVVTKTNQYLVFLKYKHQMPDGQSVLIDFIKQEIYYLAFKQGKLQSKIKEQNKDFHNKVFNHFTYSALVPIHHLKTLDFEFKNPSFSVVKRNNMITIGYYREGFLNGLGFVLSRDQSMQNIGFTLVEKGYYKNSQLCGIGQKRFQNGNLYIGEFSNNIFDGRGLLFNTERKNWVKGLFKDGAMIDMVDYEQTKDTKAPKVQQMLESLHKKKSNWVNIDVNFHKAINFDSIIQNTLSRLRQFVGGGLLSHQQKKEQMLKKIQQSFCPQTLVQGAMKKQSFPVKRLTATFGQGKVEQKKVINSFQSQYDTKNNKLRLSPMIKSPKRQKRIKSKNFATSRKQEVEFEQNDTKLSHFGNSPESKHDSSRNKTSRISNKVEEEIEVQNYSPVRKKESRLFSPSKKANVSVPRLQTSKLTNNKSPQVAQEPLMESSSNNIQLQTMTKSEIDKTLFSRTYTDTKRQTSVSASRRNKIFNETLKKSPYKNIQSYSPSGSFVETNRKEQQNNTPVSPKKLKAAGLSKPTVRSRLFNEQKSKEEEQLPTFRYSRFKTENEMSKSTKKSRIF